MTCCQYALCIRGDKLTLSLTVFSGRDARFALTRGRVGLQAETPVGRLCFHSGGADTVTIAASDWP